MLVLRNCLISASLADEKKKRKKNFRVETQQGLFRCCDGEFFTFAVVEELLCEDGNVKHSPVLPLHIFLLREDEEG